MACYLIIVTKISAHVLHRLGHNALEIRNLRIVWQSHGEGKF